MAIETKNNEETELIISLLEDYYIPDLKLPERTPPIRRVWTDARNI